MATVSGAAPCQDSQSGAEMDLNSTLDSPNWISRHIFPPTRAIVNGASRMLASVFGFESSSSSSSSSSECDSCSDDTHDNDDQEVSSQGVHTIEDREPQSFAGKKEPKRLIEQILMQESFSSTDVLEAKKLLEMKKSEMHHGTSALNYVTLKHDVEGEEGSPVGMAKSYMRTCPPWATPSKNNIEFRYPSPYSIGGNFLYSSKRKRDSPATGSWNIQDEIRKVRSKATEEMLRTLSSSKIDWSSFPLEHKNGPDSIVSNNFGPAEKDKSQSSKRPVDAPIDLAAKPASQLVQDAFHNDALPRPAIFGCEQNQVMQAIQGIEVKKVRFLRSNVTLDMGQRLQSTVDMKTELHSDVVAPDGNHLKESNSSFLPFGSTKEGTLQESQVEDKNFWTLNEVAGISSANGFPSGSNMSSEVDKEKNHTPIISKEDKAVGCGHDNAFRVVAEVKCEPLCEESMEVPMVNETDAATSGSQHSWSMPFEGSPQNQNALISEGNLAGKSNSGIEKKPQQQGKKVSRYNRRGRGRGR
ncbi:protein KAKU4 isoform X2 [Gossypium raimondii]|uniref:protein KAKU4 isoform X2 n=1 Tax=Gossypium raimondii TaxID=29730 RepID=UPI00227AD487|nr:protein KAKU4 isoform X2 [Gossypium raimondii]